MPIHLKRILLQKVLWEKALYLGQVQYFSAARLMEFLQIETKLKIHHLTQTIRIMQHSRG